MLEHEEPFEAPVSTSDAFLLTKRNMTVNNHSIKVSFIARKNYDQPYRRFHFGPDTKVSDLVEFVIVSYPNIDACQRVCQEILKRHAAGNVVVIFYPDRKPFST